MCVAVRFNQKTANNKPNYTIICWLVVSNIFDFNPYLGISILTHIFQRGWNHQLVWIFKNKSLDPLRDFIIIGLSSFIMFFNFPWEIVNDWNGTTHLPSRYDNFCWYPSVSCLVPNIIVFVVVRCCFRSNYVMSTCVRRDSTTFWVKLRSIGFFMGFPYSPGHFFCNPIPGVPIESPEIHMVDT